MFSKKSALSPGETVKKARQRHRNFDQQRAHAYKKERMFQTYLVLNKKKHFYFSLWAWPGVLPNQKNAR